MENKSRNILKQLLVGLLIFVCSVTGAFFVSKSVVDDFERPNQIIQNIVEIEESLPKEKEDLTDIISRIRKTVVNIKCSSLTSSSAGSGVIIASHDDGYYIVTNHHVINGYSNIAIELWDDTVYTARLVGGDPTGDIAVLMIEANSLTLANILGDSDTLRIGDEVIAIGNPLGELGGTVSRGIISYLDREVSVEGKMMTLIQTDTAVNAGNSGGGLFDIQGNLIGIVNAKAAQVGVEGLAFAIPSKDMLYLSGELMRTATDDTYGYVPGRTTISAEFINGYYQIGGFFGTTHEIVYVSNLKQNGAAYLAGLRKEDIIVSISFEGEKTDILRVSQIDEILEDCAIDDELVFFIKRGGLNAPETEIIITCEQYIYKV